MVMLFGWEGDCRPGSLLPGMTSKVSGGLTAYTLGSALGHTLKNEYGRALPFYLPYRWGFPSVLLSVACTVSVQAM